MIHVTRVNGSEILVNPDQIQTVERHGDTVIALTTGDKIRVKEGLDDIAEKVLIFRAEIIKRGHERS